LAYCYDNELKGKRERGVYVENKYRVTILLEKYAGASDSEIIMEHNVSHDDFKTSNRLFVWLVGSVGQFKKENDYEQEKQGGLFNQLGDQSKKKGKG